MEEARLVNLAIDRLALSFVRPYNILIDGGTDVATDPKTLEAGTLANQASAIIGGLLVELHALMQGYPDTWKPDPFKTRELARKVGSQGIKASRILVKMSEVLR